MENHTTIKTGGPEGGTDINSLSVVDTVTICSAGESLLPVCCVLAEGNEM